MAFNHSKLTVVRVQNAAGSIVNISTYCNSCQLPEELELVPTTTFGATSKTYVIGFADATFSLGGFWDPTFDAIFTALKVGFRAGTFLSRTFEYGPAGLTGGFVKYTGEFVLTSYEKDNEIDGVTEWSAEGQVTGDVSVTTW